MPAGMPGKIISLRPPAPAFVPYTELVSAFHSRLRSLGIANPQSGVSVLLLPPAFMPKWQLVVKSVFDYVVAFTALLLSFPLMLILAAGVKLSSKGPVFYRQERVGRHGKTFMIFKFRSMYTDAEKGGPGLSSLQDDRVTPFGRFMRRARFDEIPNFVNVLKGDMSLVGPRPERGFYISQIARRSPQYLSLLQIKPGITSLGQVGYGYAENVDQMIIRSRYDLNYLRNRSLAADLKILLMTVSTVIRGKGV